MKRAMIMALMASTLLTGLAAAQPSSHAAKGAKGGEAQPGASSRSMDAPYLAVPVVRDGQLVNYLFVSIRVEINQGVDLWETREKAHLLRDALVRASHVNTLADPRDNNLLNRPHAIQVYRAVAAQVLGERAVGPVTIVSSYSSRGPSVTQP